jgi:hypothetical protein
MRRILLLQLAALVVVLSGLAPWAEGVSGFDLARTVTAAAGDIDGLPPAWVGWAWFVLPLLGFAAWLALYVPRRPPRHLALLLGIAVAVFAIAFRFAAQANDADPGWGVYLVFFLGVALIVVDRIAASGARLSTSETF